ncbi:hypothetical protein M407DRAFT_242984 [Tulasnella calospora MUT 4182]|uniref:Uncharacterized protein n=1 Tax=Tulasnella calospora MUT 4182 TaxID=1051891 RepID=A0A0C3L420_9AGAM|nr:hypothetical protein M407DRAFT_242984 [Tulasnella calospora MUT 4182]
MWRVFPNNAILPYWHTGDDANPGLDFVLRENAFIRLCLSPSGVDKPRAGWEVITLRFKPM